MTITPLKANSILDVRQKPGLNKSIAKELNLKDKPLSSISRTRAAFLLRCDSAYINRTGYRYLVNLQAKP